MVLVIADMVLHLRSRIKRFLVGSSGVKDPVPKVTPVATPVPKQTASGSDFSNSSLTLQQMLESAKAVKNYYDRSEALRQVAEYAVTLGAYKKAIEAGDADLNYYGKSDTLKLVAISAAHGGSFEEAVKAAKKIPNEYTHGEATKRVLEIQSKLDS